MIVFYDSVRDLIFPEIPLTFFFFFLLMICCSLSYGFTSFKEYASVILCGLFLWRFLIFLVCFIKLVIYIPGFSIFRVLDFSFS